MVKCKNVELWKKISIIVFMMLCVFFGIFNPKFETNDDSAMAGISSGIRGGYNGHLIFINIILGKIIKIFMEICPQVKWYVICQYLLIGISFTIILFSINILFENRKSKILYMIMAIIISVWGYECFVNLQFTKTAGCCGISGGIVIFTYMKNKSIGKPYLLLGIILMCISSCIRFNVFEFIILLFLSIGVFEFVDSYKYKKDIKEICKYIIIFLITIIMAFLLKKVDSVVYNSNSEWKSYREFNTLRAELLDRGFPEYVSNKEKYDELGITEIDINMWNSWNFADKEAFTTETMKSIIALKSKKEINLEFITQFIKIFGKGFLLERVFWGYILLLILWFLYSRKGIIGVISLNVILILVNMYFLYNNRYLQYRVDTVMWFAAGLIMVYFIAENRSIENVNLKTFILSITLLVIWNMSVYLDNILVDKSTKEYQKEIYREYLENISEDKENIYFVSVGSSPENAAYEIFDLPEVGLLDNYYSLGGWQTNSPITNSVLKTYNFKNPFREMVDNENAYLVENNNIDLLLQYIRSRYDENAYYVLIKEIAGNRIFKIVTKQPEIEMSQVIYNNSEIVNSEMIIQQNGCEYILTGIAYKKESNSFRQKNYTVLYNHEKNEYSYFYSLQKEQEGIEDIDNGKYSIYETKINALNLSAGKYTIFQMLDINGEIYCADIVEFNK